MSHCLLCDVGRVEQLIDLGQQPVTSHFLGPAEVVPEAHPLRLGVCSGCGMVQLLCPFPATSLTPPYAWITYREPGDHLDETVSGLLALEGMGAGASAMGVSFKDHSTIERLREAGIARAVCLDVHEDFGALSPTAGIEAVHGGLSRDVGAAIVDKHGAADLVIARHIVEHAGKPERFIAMLGALLRDGGYLMIEVPDSSKNLARADYTMIWEEHTLYLTETTAPHLLAGQGFELISLVRHAYAFEDVFVLVARKAATGGAALQTFPKPFGNAKDVARARAFAAAFPAWTKRYREAIIALAAGRPAALYGAGHLTAAYVNFHGLSDLFAFVVDDTAEKQGLRMPGSGLEIAPRDRLVTDGVGLCLFGFSPDIEDRVIANNAAFIAAGGVFRSIFADSPRSIRNECAGIPQT